MSETIDAFRNVEILANEKCCFKNRVTVEQYAQYMYVATNRLNKNKLSTFDMLGYRSAMLCVIFLFHSPQQKRSPSTPEKCFKRAKVFP